MARHTVPVDMSSEQKSILGIISKRQLIYLIAGGGLIYSYTPFIFNVFGKDLVAIILCAIAGLPTAIITLIFAFYKKSKYHMFFDQYLIVKMSYKNQLGNWRKGD